MTAQAEREQVAATLGRYVPEAVARRLIDDPDALAPQERHAAILVMDIAGFTAYSAGRAPGEVIDRLNGFLAGCAEVISRHDGVVIQFTGDGLMASFGTPIDSDAPERAAIAACHGLLAEAQVSGFSIRIGLAAGTVASGSIGSSSRQAFTVYGDTVNRAARLEAHGKMLGRAVLMDAAVAGHAGDGLERFAGLELEGLAGKVDVVALG